MSAPSESRAALPSGEWARVSELVERFESAWERGERPALEDYLPPSGPERPSALRELAHTDLEYRLKAGEAVGAEAYLGRFPELAADRAAALGLIEAEDRLLRRLGRGRPPEDYLRRFPQYGADLATRLPGAAPRDDPLPTPSPMASTLRIDTPAPSGSGPRPPSVPGYEIVKELGRGGMGVVYLARQVSLGRLVALKMIRAGAGADAEELGRFRFEAEAVARLQHPNVVQVHEVGEHDGLPYFSLEYFEGGSLAQRLAGTPMVARPAAELVELLARAVGAAHERGILHRDLKPANVLLTADGRPKVTDFGLAKRLGADAGHTQTGAVMGTPSYMAPEQARGKTKEVGPAADVYALGAVLYECLTGRPPFRAATLMETLEQVCTRDPAAPRQLNPAVPRDLETVCLKALAKEPARRYASAAALADDLGRFLRGEPIAARRVGRGERLLLWSRRRPALAAVCVLAPLVATVIPAALGVTWLWQQAEDNRKGAEQARGQLQIALTGQREATQEADTQRQTAEGLAEERMKLARGLEQSRYFRNVDLALREFGDGRLGRARRLLIEECPERLRGWEWHYVNRLCHAELATLPRQDVPVQSVALSADGSLVAAGGGNDAAPKPPGSVWLWEADTGKELFSSHGLPKTTRAVALSPDGRLIAASLFTLGVPGGEIKVWDWRAGREVFAHAEPGGVGGVCFSPDGKWLAGFLDEAVQLWDTATGAAGVRCVPSAPLTGMLGSVAFSADGKRLAASLFGWAIDVWDARTGKRERELHDRKSAEGDPSGLIVRGVAFSPDGKRLVTASRVLTLWDLESGKVLRTLTEPDGYGGACFSPDGRSLAAAVANRVRVYDAGLEKPPVTLLGHVDPITQLAYSGDGRRLASAGQGGEVKVWDPRREPEARTLRGNVVGARDVAFSPDGRLLAVLGSVDVVRVWETKDWKPLALAKGVGTRELVSEGRQLATISDKALVWDLATGKKLAVKSKLTLNAETALAMSDDGGRFAAEQADRSVKVWDAQTGEEIAAWGGGPARASMGTFGPGGKLLAFASADGVELAWWDVATGRQVHAARLPGDRLLSVAFSPDGRWVAAGGNGIVQVWRAETGELVHSLPLEASSSLRVRFSRFRLRFSPDGKRLAVPLTDGTIKLWDVETGQECLTLKGHDGFVPSVCFSPDGRLMASTSYDGTVRVWDATPVP
jgi:WD40 repeat protein